MIVVGAGLVVACGRSGLEGSDVPPNDAREPESQPETSEPDDHEPDDDEPELPGEPGALPEVTVAVQRSRVATDTAEGNAELSLVAPIDDPESVFQLTSGEYARYDFSPGGRRLVFLQAGTLWLVDTWPPEPEPLSSEVVETFAWVDAHRVAFTTAENMAVVDTDTRSNQWLLPRPFSFELYLLQPSPNGRWLAYGTADSEQKRIWLYDFESTDGDPIHFVAQLPGGTGVAWFDWAPDSEHLAYVRFQDASLSAFVVDTLDGVGEPVPLHEPFGPEEQIPTFQWSPTGKSLQYLYQRAAPGEETLQRLYWVDLSASAPSAPVLLTSFDERYWSSQGYWSPGGDAIAFSARFAPDRLFANQFVVRVGAAPAAPEAQDPDGFFQVLKQAWAPDGAALYFTAMYDDEIERLYRTELRGVSSLVSDPESDLRGLMVSEQPGCLAYTQFAPEPAVMVVDEQRSQVTKVSAPEANNPDYTGSFNSSRGAWVSDGDGVRGLLLVASPDTGGEAMAWVPVDDCRPSASRVLLSAMRGLSVSNFEVSTAPRPTERY